MSRHVQAWMDGVALSTIGPILIKEVHEDAPTLNVMYDDRPVRYGQTVSVRKRSSIRVAIEMQIRQLFDLQRRSHACEQIARWARGTTLELSNHPRRRLHVVCTAEPSLGAVRDYTSVVRVEFEASAVPYWEDQTPTTATVLAGGASLLNAGSVEAPVCVQVVPSGTLTEFSITAGGQTVSFTGLSVTAQQRLVITRDQRDNLIATVAGVSQLSHRTASSADDLFVAPGVAQIAYTADTTCTVTASIRGRYA